MPAQQKHNGIAQCPNCNVCNVVSVFAYGGSRLYKINGFGACVKCQKIFKVVLLEKIVEEIGRGDVE
jgi:hypothetical protein